MEIISLSIDDETLDKIEEIQEEASFNGRSELIRKAVENLHQETSKREELEGHLNAVIVARHSHDEEYKIAEISHRFDNVITTQLHSKVDREKCLEVFNTDGKASEVIEFYNKLEGSRHTESVNILPQN
ncbi:MAG: CopG family ribbon-helix-helix protein [Candidatus Nanohalobium sp.]